VTLVRTTTWLLRVAASCGLALMGSAPAQGMENQSCQVCDCLEEVGKLAFGELPPPEDAAGYPQLLPSCEWSNVQAAQISESSFSFMLPHTIERYANMDEASRSACSARWSFLLDNLSKPLEPICIEGQAPEGDAFTDEVVARCDEDQHLFAAARAADQRARSEDAGECPAWTSDLTPRAIVFLRGDNVNFLRARDVLGRLVSLVESEPQLERPLWLMIQHADNEPSFQQAGLEAYAELVDKGLGNPQRYAGLVDRSLMRAENRQRYGTHWRCVDGEAILSTELAAPDKVDEERARLGLPPLEDFLAEVAEERCSASEQSAAQ